MDTKMGFTKTHVQKIGTTYQKRTKNVQKEASPPFDH